MKQSTRIIYISILTVAILLVASGDSLACSCELPQPGKTVKQLVAAARKESRAVFSGTVVAIDRQPGDFHQAVKFRVEEILKGALKREVVVFTGLGGGDCGYKFEVGEQYLVYAYKSSDTHLATNICQRTANLVEAAEDLKALGKGKSRLTGPSRGAYKQR